MKHAAFLIALVGFACAAMPANDVEPASKLIDDARKEAAVKKKNVLVLFDASW